MKIFLSALEGAKLNKTINVADILIKEDVKLKWNLMSYYYIRDKNYELAQRIRDYSEQILIDSGAHSFQFGKKVDWIKYTKEYASFIQKFDQPKVIGYFEMDVENIIGIEKVLYLRSILENVSDKIIPVWHPLRGINNFEEMCDKYKGKIIAIGGFAKTDIRDEQFAMFLKVARKYGCKVHCLGMTREKILQKIPFDYVDSSTWVQSTVYGRIDNKTRVPMSFTKNHRDRLYVENYKVWLQKQKRYYDLWRKECND